MATYDYLRKQALKDIWRVPDLNREYILAPQRVTKQYGRKKTATVMWDTVRLPDDTSVWHVYDASAWTGLVLNLFTKCNEWTSLSDAINKRAVYVDAYINNGVQLPRFDTYYRYTESGALIFAAKINKRLQMNLDRDDFFIRVYTSALNSIGQVPPVTTKVKTNGYYITNDRDRLELAEEIDLLPTTGQVHVYCNGVLYGELEYSPALVGDYIEYIWDDSFKKREEFAIKDLFFYQSDRDSDQKYLLHLPKSHEITFRGDVDFYIVMKDEHGEDYCGVYYHKNDEANIRQLTHNDFGLRTRAIPTIANVIAYAASLLDVPIDNLYIRMDIRDTAVRPNVLTFEHTRLFELYKLSEEDIVYALQGKDSVVEMWSAPALEKSWYSNIMGCTYNELSKEVAERTYGYNAAAKIVGDTPVKVVPGELVKLPIRMQHGCTVYEYDAGGLFLGWHQHLGGVEYEAQDPDAVYLEAIVGLGSDRLDQLQNVRETELNEVYTYRIYNGSLIGNVVQPTFEDVTGSDKYEVVDGKFKWLSTRQADYPIIMSDGSFFAKDYKVKQNFGTISITLMTQQSRPLGDGLYVMPFPMGQIDVIMNGYSLMQGLDYFVDFPRIHIVNKGFLINPMTDEQSIHIRFCGFSKNFKILDDGDVGFVEHGFLSNNNRFDLRDDKVQRIIVGGMFRSKEDLEFSEEHSGVSVINLDNGLPYMVKDILVPVKPYTVDDMYELKDQSEKVDKIVSDYMTVKMPQPDRGPVMAVTNKHQVFSPFMNKLISDLRNNVLRLPNRPNGFEKQEVLSICKSYESLLQFDPLRSPHLQDKRFVIIHPHGYPYAVAVSANAYRFLSKVAEYYGSELVSLSPFLKTA
jgi:hypothetical protein